MCKNYQRMKREEKRKQNMGTLNEVAAKAKQEGMTYGQYVAKMYLS